MATDRSTTALILIDPQLDYFAGGLYPLANSDALLPVWTQLIEHAQQQGMPVIFVQHLVPAGPQPGPFFNADSEGAAIHPVLRRAAPDAHVIIKHHADSFDETALLSLLNQLGSDSLWLCGMMTQNCVTHTALSPQAAGFSVTVIGDACTTREPMLHLIALRALSRRVAVTDTNNLPEAPEA
ncbi:cysteine hydrolase family protein [Thalassolituus sp. LLYu03]|uniref:cysteine hydrolase family protein n=1 Tax=Thalassolituus sp. LLYu03 TaxID=3421656 RepID=UPI003D2E02D2